MDNTGHREIFNSENFQHLNITIIGCGAIGSSTAEVLTRMGFTNFRFVDFDTIESHNLANQLYFHGDLGKRKVEALMDKVRMINPQMNIQLQDTRLETSTPIEGDIVVMAVDNMATRQLIFNSIAQQEEKPLLVIDGRMGGLTYDIYTFNPENPDESSGYLASLHSDAEATPLRCSEKGIIYNTFGIGAEIGNNVKKFLNQESYSREIMYNFNTGDRIQV